MVVARQGRARLGGERDGEGFLERHHQGPVRGVPIAEHLGVGLHRRFVGFVVDVFVEVQLEVGGRAGPALGLGEAAHIHLHGLDIAALVAARVDLLREARHRDAQPVRVRPHEQVGSAQHIEAGADGAMNSARANRADELVEFRDAEEVRSS